MSNRAELKQNFIAYLKENPYQVEVIGFNGYNDPPEIMDFIEKYIDRAPGPGESHY